jgi:uncharacterized protein YfkK (UPF0435 family)
MITVNETLIPKLQTTAKNKEFAKDVFSILASRERFRSRSDIDAIFRELETLKGTQLDYFKYLDVWKDIEKMGLGTMVYGRKGNPNRFVWNANLKHVGRLALGMSARPEAPVKETPKPEPVKAAPPIPPTSIKRRPAAPKKEEVKAAAPKREEEKSHSVTFVIPASVPIEEIMALLTLGAQLTAKSPDKQVK